MLDFTQRIVGEGLTYDDVLLLPSYSEVLPRDVNITGRLSRNIELKVPIVAAAMDTVTEFEMAIAIAQNGGLGMIHKNMSIERQAQEVRKVKLEGITGTIEFDSKGDIQKAKYFVMQVAGTGNWADNKLIKVIEVAAPQK